MPPTTFPLEKSEAEFLSPLSMHPNYSLHFASSESNPVFEATKAKEESKVVAVVRLSIDLAAKRATSHQAEQ